MNNACSSEGVAGGRNARVHTKALANKLEGFGKHGNAFIKLENFCYNSVRRCIYLLYCNVECVSFAVTFIFCDQPVGRVVTRLSMEQKI